MAGTNRGYISLYALSNDHTTPTCTSPGDVVHSRLYLPELQLGHAYVNLYARTGPLSARPGTPLAPSNFMMIVEGTLEDDKGVQGNDIRFVVSTSLLEEYTPNGGRLAKCATPRPTTDPIHIMWSDWGPNHTRLLPYFERPRYWVWPSIHGSRSVLRVSQDDDNANPDANMYFDFADARGSRYVEARCKGTVDLGPLACKTKTRTEFKVELVGDEGIFKEPVITKLPYYATEFAWETSKDEELLISDDLLVRMFDFVSSTKKLRLDVYAF
ncbi:hypothetical protein PENSPDRAFT_658401 [Peniophora sp. CONT]|nr:hypothetical protein PENSPDRAFT_658401 [Peniophora sp. CONT]